MAVANIWKPDRIVLASTVTFSQFETQGVSPQVKSEMLRLAGHPSPMGRSLRGVQPIITFTTNEVDKVAANIPITGLALTDDSFLYFKHGATSGVSAADARSSTTHARYVVAQLVAYWTKIGGEHGSAATAEVTIVAVFDGTNAPLVYAGTVALSSTFAVNNAIEFGPGPCSSTSTVVGALNLRPKSININSGVELIQEGNASEVYDTFVGINTIDPTIEIQSHERLSMGSFGLLGDTLSSTGVIGYFRKIGERAADASTVHLKFSSAYGVIEPGDESVNDGIWMDTVRIRLLAADDTTQPITFTASSAIT